MMASQTRKKVLELFSEFDETAAPGCALGVLNRGEVIVSRGFGLASLRDERALTPLTAMNICSLAKEFTAACLCLLERQAKIDLARDVREYIPELPEFRSCVSVTHLMQHTSGVRDYIELSFVEGRDFGQYSTTDVVEAISRSPRLNFEPGEQCMYCNSGYVLLGEVVARVAGRPFPEAVQTLIFEPLGMSGTFFHRAASESTADRAVGYHFVEDRFSELEAAPGRVFGDAGVWSTLEDLLRWDANFYENKLAGGQDLFTRMATAGTLNDGRRLSYGLGVMLGEFRGHEMVYHSGSGGGFKGAHLRFPRHDLSVVYLSNRGPTERPMAQAKEVASAFLPAEASSISGDERAPIEGFGRAVSDGIAERPADAGVGVASLQDLVGTYHCAELDSSYEVFLRDSDLVIELRESRHTDPFRSPVLILNATDSKPSKRDRFRVTVGPVEADITPVRTGGRVVALSLDTPRVRGLHFRRL